MAMLSRVHDRAREALRGGDLEMASSLVSLIWRHFAEDVDTLELHGEVELARGHRIEARSSLATVLDIDPERLLARSGLALIAEEEDDLDEALRQFEFAYALDTGNQQLAAEIARLHSRLNHTMPVDPEASRYAVAWRHLWEGRYDRATSLFQSGLKADPESVEQAVGLAQSLWFAGQSSAAEEVAGDIVTSHPNCLKPLAILAGAAFSRGDEAALSILRRTAQLNPGNERQTGACQQPLRIDIQHSGQRRSSLNPVAARQFHLST
ncbi:MAG TPA: tetratricopeptide repeat protein, partial [Chloroflexota bacterium]|nr:tetratricopeptide repeat protein [Chloroflexota bacterium]